MVLDPDVDPVVFGLGRDLAERFDLGLEVSLPALQAAAPAVALQQVADGGADDGRADFVRGLQGGAQGRGIGREIRAAGVQDDVQLVPGQEFFEGLQLGRGFLLQGAGGAFDTPQAAVEGQPGQVFGDKGIEFAAGFPVGAGETPGAQAYFHGLISLDSQIVYGDVLLFSGREILDPHLAG